MVVRSPDAARLRSALEADGATVTDADGALEVAGIPIERVGELAARDGLILHELRTRAHTLEQAFLSLTEAQGDSGVPPELPEAPPRSDLP